MAGKKSAKKMTTVAVLEEDLTLVGFVKKIEKDVHPDDIIVPENCDLATDSRYKWVPEEGAFVPLGHGFGKPDRPPVPESEVLYLMAKALTNDTPVPMEVQEWCAWYEKNIEKQQAELRKVKGT